MAQVGNRSYVSVCPNYRYCTFRWLTFNVPRSGSKVNAIGQNSGSQDEKRVFYLASA